MSIALAKTTAPPRDLAVALSSSAAIVMALRECDDELRQGAMTLFEQLHSGELSDDERQATVALLEEMLFPQADRPDLDFDNEGNEAIELVERMDRDEAVFADRLRDAMKSHGVTQADLAAKLGIGQPAISMMLNRNCRPQRRTIARIAEALGIAEADLWPGG